MALKFYQGVPTTHHAIFCLHCLLCQCIAFVSLWFLLPLPHCWFMVSISKYSTDCVSVFAILRVTMDTSLSCENCCPSPQSLSIRKFSVSIMATYCAVNEWLPSFGISLFVNLCSPISCLVASWWKALFINISQALNQCERKTHGNVNCTLFLVYQSYYTICAYYIHLPNTKCVKPNQPLFKYHISLVVSSPMPTLTSIAQKRPCKTDF